MSPRAPRRSLLLAMLACAALFFVPASFFGAPPAVGDPSQPGAQASGAAQVSPDAIEVHSIEVHSGQSESDGKPVEDFYCVPLAPGAHPAVILLHGAVKRGDGNQGFADQCRKLAAAGYYAMFVEYYSQAGPARPGDPPVTGKGFAAWVDGNLPTWTREVVDAINVLDQNRAVEAHRIALIRTSLAALLALPVGASQHARVPSLVHYY